MNTLLHAISYRGALLSTLLHATVYDYTQFAECTDTDYNKMQIKTNLWCSVFRVLLLNLQHVLAPLLAPV
jgi:hypothetical protein